MYNTGSGPDGHKCQIAGQNMANKPKQADGCRFLITRIGESKNAMLLWNLAGKHCK